MNGPNLIQVTLRKGHIIKTIAKIFAKRFASGIINMMINDKGIFIQESTKDGGLTLELYLKRVEFMRWVIPAVEGNPNAVFVLGIPVEDFKKATQQISKTESVTIRISADNKDSMIIERSSDVSKLDESSLMSSFSLQQSELDKVISPNYSGFQPTITMSSHEYTTFATAAAKQSKLNLRVTGQTNSIHVQGNDSTINKLEKIIGMWNPQGAICYDEIIPTGNFNVLSDVSAITTKSNSGIIRIYAIDGKPLRISTSLGSVGHISAYISRMSASGAMPSGSIGNVSRLELLTSGSRTDVDSGDNNVHLLEYGNNNSGGGGGGSISNYNNNNYNMQKNHYDPNAVYNPNGGYGGYSNNTTNMQMTF